MTLGVRQWPFGGSGDEVRSRTQEPAIPGAPLIHKPTPRPAHHRVRRTGPVQRIRIRPRTEDPTSGPCESSGSLSRRVAVSAASKEETGQEILRGSHGTAWGILAAGTPYLLAPRLTGRHKAPHIIISNIWRTYRRWLQLTRITSHIISHLIM